MTVVVDSLSVVMGRGGLMARDYENGVVVCNDSGQSQLLPFNPAWELLDADGQRSRYPYWLDGQSISIPHRDGLVFRSGDEGLDLYLNEFLADNTSICEDEEGEFEDWIEIYNGGRNTVALGGLFLSNDWDDPERWAFPSTNLEPGRYLLVWCDGETTEGPLHAGFTLDAEGGELGIFGPGGNGAATLDSYRYGPQSPDISAGRARDGGLPWVVYEEPSPGGLNTSVEAPGWSGGLDLLPCFPNPFNPATRISFIAPAGGPVRLELFDASGRSVAVLMEGPAAPGLNTLQWNGRSREGGALASGIYLLRLRGEEGSCSRKLVHVR
jgi:hypothetical protein